MSHYYLEVTAVPPGEAPLWVREKWVGLSLPLKQGDANTHSFIGAGVLTGPRGLLAHITWLLKRKYERHTGHRVEVLTAIKILESSSPEAAKWWRENTPYLVRPQRYFVFQGRVTSHTPTFDTLKSIPLNEVFETKFYPDNFTDGLIALLVFIVQTSILFILPSLTIYFLSNSFPLALLTYFYVSCVLSLFSINKITINDLGIVFDRTYGSPKFIKWNEIKSITPAESRDVILNGWLWPIFPFREFTKCLSSQGHFKIVYSDGYTFYAPKDSERFKITLDNIIWRDDSIEPTTADKPASVLNKLSLDKKILKYFLAIIAFVSSGISLLGFVMIGTGLGFIRKGQVDSDSKFFLICGLAIALSYFIFIKLTKSRLSDANQIIFRKFSNLGYTSAFVYFIYAIYSQL